MVKLVNPRALTETAPLNQVVWAALEKIGKKQLKPAELEQGTSHDIAMEIRGTINGEAFLQTIQSVLSIGFEQTKSSSVNPQVPQLIALILGKLNTATRERILADIPTEFADNENQLPDSDTAIVESVERMLRSLRRSKTVTSRGPVKCEFTL